MPCLPDVSFSGKSHWTDTFFTAELPEEEHSALSSELYLFSALKSTLADVQVFQDVV